MKQTKYFFSLMVSIIFLQLVAQNSYAVQLENWRSPFFSMAAKMGQFQASPSGMFWDNLDMTDSTCTLFNKTLWPNSNSYGMNHWNLEPDLAYSVRNTNDYYGKNTSFHLSALNDIKYNQFLLRQVLDVDTRYMDDPGYPWMKERFAAGRVAEAYLQYSFSHGFLRLGRTNRNWGPFLDRSLILSNNTFSYDALELGLHSSLFEFRHLFSAFPQSTVGMDADVNGTSRYLSAHSLNLLLGRFGSCGITETVLFTRDKGFPDLQYVNPISIYSVVNTNGEGSGGNLMLAFQWNIHPFTDKVDIKGQVMLDDFQIDNEDEGDQEPTHWGGDFGIFAHEFLPLSLHHVASLEYRYCSRWMYTVTNGKTNEGGRYTYLGKSIGYPSIDCDSLNLSFSVIGNNFWLGYAGISYSRKGENAITTLWNEPAIVLEGEGLGYRTEPQIPSGVVESAIGITTEIRSYYKNFASAWLSINNRWIENQGHIKKAYYYQPVVSLTVQCRYSNFFIKLPQK